MKTPCPCCIQRQALQAVDDAFRQPSLVTYLPPSVIGQVRSALNGPKDAIFIEESMANEIVKLRRALQRCLDALTDETGNVARRESNACDEARAALERSRRTHRGLDESPA